MLPPLAALLSAWALTALWHSAIRRMDLAKATAIMLSYPALTFLFSLALGRETFHVAEGIGLALTLSGGAWLSLQVLRGSGHRPAMDAADMEPVRP